MLIFRHNEFHKKVSTCAVKQGYEKWWLLASFALYTHEPANIGVEIQGYNPVIETA